MDHIFLYGPPGTGKSTLGKKLAGHFSMPFLDLDSLIEMKAGMSISQIMQQRGESVFRDLECAALNEILGDSGSAESSRNSVIALGGGALLRSDNRAIAEAGGTIILLTAELPTLLARLTNDSERRPLLKGDLQASLSALLAQRADHYASFPLSIRVDRKTARQNIQSLQAALGRYHLSAMGEYDVIVGRLAQLTGLVERQNPVIVTDENVAKLHLDAVKQLLGPDTKSIIVPAGEGHKNLETISLLWKAFLENGLDRKATVIALGGGVVGDLSGFAASTYMRGIAWVAIPTTLLSMVDASLGGKTGFDLPEGKNLIGAFHPPKLVLVDAQLLNSLPEMEFTSGMAEVVKHGIISDPELFSFCGRGLDWVKDNLDDVLKRAIAVKINIIEADPYEIGFRAALNLGHTVGHAVELVSKFNLRHGEAVAIGMVAEAKYAARIGLAAPGLADALSGVLNALGLPIRIPEGMSRDVIVRAMKVDKKKNANAIRFALPVEIGKVELVDVTDLESVLEGA